MIEYAILDLRIARLQERVEESYTLTSLTTIESASEDVLHFVVLDTLFAKSTIIFAASYTRCALAALSASAVQELISELCNREHNNTVNVSAAYLARLHELDNAAYALTSYMCERFYEEDAQRENSVTDRVFLSERTLSASKAAQ